LLKKRTQEFEIYCIKIFTVSAYNEENESKDYGFTMIKLLEDLAKSPRISGIANFSGNRSEIRKRITMIKLFKRNAYNLSLLGLAVILLLSAATLTNSKTAASTTGISPATQSKAVTIGTNDIDHNLNKIINNKAVSVSSNPNEYIKANPEAYGKLLDKGEIGFQALLDMLRKSQQDGLKEWIMAKACEEILQGNITINGWSTGKAWLKEYEAAAAHSPYTVVQGNP
jgi:beta-lactamase regulating signal transducer with metallopeptidase domain